MKKNIHREDLFQIKLINDPQISPDGRRIVFSVKIVDREKNRYFSHLWIIDLESDEVRQFTYGNTNDACPRWSPDGRRIAFLRAKGGRTQIWFIDITGGEAREASKFPEGRLGPIAWSPDG